MPKGTRVARCVEKVKKKGGGVNPYAVCQSATGQSYATGRSKTKSGKAVGSESFERRLDIAFGTDNQPQLVEASIKLIEQPTVDSDRIVFELDKHALQYIYDSKMAGVKLAEIVAKMPFNQLAKESIGVNISDWAPMLYGNKLVVENGNERDPIVNDGDIVEEGLGRLEMIIEQLSRSVSNPATFNDIVIKLREVHAELQEYYINHLRKAHRSYYEQRKVL